jgi:hypothetical protein
LEPWLSASRSLDPPIQFGAAEESSHDFAADRAADELCTLLGIEVEDDE